MHTTARADVLLSEWALPDMQGDELCQRLRAADDGGRHTYFIFLVPSGDHTQVLAGMRAGADDYQELPIDLPALEGRLLSATRVLELHRKARRRASGQLPAALNPAAADAVAMRERMSEEVAQIFAAAKRYKRRCCVALCALEDLSHVHAGERARTIDEAARAARASLRDSDAFFRVSDGEFLIVLPEQTLNDSMIVVHRVRDRIAKLDLKLSIGLAQVEPFDATAEGWISRTERALMHARSVGGGVVAIDA